jgi:hypothetical protein
VPVKPRELEEHLDYVTHHQRSIPLTEGQSRDAVDMMIRQETARSTGFHSPLSLLIACFLGYVSTLILLPWDLPSF